MKRRYFSILLVVFVSFLTISSTYGQKMLKSSANVLVKIDWLYHGEKCEKAGMPEFTWKLTFKKNNDTIQYIVDCMKSYGDDADDWEGDFMPSLAPNRDRGRGWFWRRRGVYDYPFSGVINRDDPGRIPFYIPECFENDKKGRCDYDKGKDGCYYEDKEGKNLQYVDINQIVPFQWSNNKDYYFDYNKIGVSFDVYWTPFKLALAAPTNVKKDTIYNTQYKRFEQVDGKNVCAGENMELKCSKAYGHPDLNPVKYYWEAFCADDPSFTSWTVFKITNNPEVIFNTPSTIGASRDYFFRVRPYYSFAGQFGSFYSNVTNKKVGPARPIVSADALSIIPPSCYKYNDGLLTIDFSKISSLAVPKKFDYNLASDITEYGSSVSNVTSNYPFDSLSVNYSSSNKSDVPQMSYTLQIINTDGECATLVKNIILTQPDILLADTSVGIYTNSNVSCYDSSNGNVALSGIGGTKPYEFYINEFPLGNTLASSAPNDRGYGFRNLKPEIRYDFFLTDKNGCKAYKPSNIDDEAGAGLDSLYLTKPSPIVDTVFARRYLNELGQKPHNVSCFNYDNAELYTQILRDSTELLNPPYKIWVNGRSDYGTTPYFNTSTYITPGGKLKKGFYTIKITDANDCPHEDTITLFEPEKLIMTKTDSAMILCWGEPDGMLTVNVKGGTKAYTFTKDVINIGPAPTKDPRIIVLSDSTAKYWNLISGINATHTMYSTDLNGCKDSVRFDLSEPDPLEVLLDSTNIVCNNQENGKLRALVEGGTTPYTYEWSNGSLIAGETSFELDSLKPITYIVRVKDNNNCERSANYKLVNPAPIVASVRESIPLSCANDNNASISIDSIEGGWQGFMFTKDGISYFPDPYFNNLSAGVFDKLAIKDVNGCIKKLDTIEIKRPKALTATLIENNGVGCFGGNNARVIIKVTEGKKPYNVSFAGQQLQGYDSLYLFSGLSSGSHILSLYDKNNCSMAREIYIGSPEKLKDTILSVSKATNGLNDGSATIAAIGGVPPYNYTWLLPNQVAPNDKKVIKSEYDPISVGNLYADLYEVQISDAKGCWHTAYVGVSNITGPIIDSIHALTPSCSYTTDGSIEVFASSTNAPITYYWPALSDTDSQVSLLGDGSYDVKITDVSGVTTKRIYLNSPEELIITLTNDPSACYGQCDGLIEAKLIGGTQPYQYVWNDSQAQSNYIAINLCEGDYSLDVLDAQGCAANANTTLVNPAKVLANLGNSATICSGQVMFLDAKNEGSSYLWTSSFGYLASTQVIQTKIPGTYYLTIVNPFGCIGKDTFLLETSSTALVAEFVEPTKNYVGEKIVLSEISWPRPESVEWYLGSSDSVTIIGTTKFLKTIVYNYPGIYKIRMVAKLGECRDTMEKIIKIYAPGDIDGYKNGKIAKTGIESLGLYPNPNNGHFIASVSLYNETPVKFSIHDMYGTMLKEIQKEGLSQYDVNFDFNLSQGVYSVRATTVDDSKSIMFTIQY